ncbi:MAG: methionine biosynthesis protein MetW [Dehalococcoidia bacterium]|nr:MAG: methionine biosynthesis protein MetW [Dehalococcoidia bacterium]
MKFDAAKLEYDIITEWVAPGSSVLDLGCGDGELSARLVKEKKASVQGIEIDEQAIYKCVARGLSVLHGDIDSGLTDYADKSFDYVILNESFQQVKKPDLVLTESLRVGKKVIVSFPNFVHYTARWQLFFKGTVPVTPSLPYEWYNTPNLHFLSIKDFIGFCRKRSIKIEKAGFVGKSGRARLLPNLTALVGIFLISNK